MLPELTLAIMERVKDSAAGSDLRDLISSRIYEENAPENPTYPYVVFYDVGGNPEWTEFQVFDEFQAVQFSIFDSGVDNTTVKDIYKVIATLFDNCESGLSVSGYTTLLCMRELNVLTQDPDDQTWTYKVQYQIQLEVA